MYHIIYLKNQIFYFFLFYFLNELKNVLLNNLTASKQLNSHLNFNFFKHFLNYQSQLIYENQTHIKLCPHIFQVIIFKFFYQEQHFKFT